MILPVYVYGNPVLRKRAQEISEDDPELNELIENMFETMYHSDGVGLAAPQVGVSKRLFVIDATPMAEDDPSLENFKKVFINPIIFEETGDKWAYNEGCLSLPNIREDVDRKSNIKIEYFNENFELLEDEYDGIKARIIQHEYDHLEGKLFIDHLNPIKRKLLAARLNAISKGKADVAYKIRLPKK